MSFPPMADVRQMGPGPLSWLVQKFGNDGCPARGPRGAAATIKSITSAITYKSSVTMPRRRRRVRERGRLSNRPTAEPLLAVEAWSSLLRWQEQ